MCFSQHPLVNLRKFLPQYEKNVRKFRTLTKIFFSEESSKNNSMEEAENLKNTAESLQNNLDKTEECKENKDIISPNIKQCELSPTGEGKTLNTSDSGEFANVISECNGGCESPVKEEEASPDSGSIDSKTINSACDENTMDESPTEPAPEGDQAQVEEDEQGNDDADVNTGKLMVDCVSDFILPILQPNTGCFPIQKRPVFS